MKRFIALAAAFCLVFVASVMTPSANAQNGDRKSVVTFSEPVEIPGGTILPAGTYFFKLLNSDSGRWVVQIFNENQTHTYATVITVQDFRYHPTDKGVMTFAERPAGEPPAIKEWFFPGENFGREFVYPKNRALQLAKQVNEPVLSMQGDTAEVTPQTPVTAYSAAGEEVAPSTVVQTEAPAPAPAAPAAVPASVQETTPVATPATDLPLPKTASSDPAIGLFGLLAMVGAVGLAARRRRSA
jgi:LPXTG-motif cell wall-anchored protein